jgi:hypothetical protein
VFEREWVEARLVKGRSLRPERSCSMHSVGSQACARDGTSAVRSTHSKRGVDHVRASFMPARTSEQPTRRRLNPSWELACVRAGEGRPAAPGICCGSAGAPPRLAAAVQRRSLWLVMETRDGTACAAEGVLGRAAREARRSMRSTATLPAYSRPSPPNSSPVHWSTPSQCAHKQKWYPGG